MKVVFNKNDNGTEEISSLMGWMDEDFEYDQLHRNVVSSTREVISILGKTVYEEIADYYLQDSEDDLEIEIYEQLQVVILLDAYRNFAPNKDLAHTPTGRKARVDEHEKMPFEWMLDRSNQGMERAFHKAFDELLILLDDNDTWTGSDEYKEMHSTWIARTEVFKDFYPDASRFLLLKLAPGFKRAQKKKIKSRLSPDMYTSINNAITSGSEITSFEDVIELSREIIALSGIAWGLDHLRVTIFPEGILQPATGDRTTTKSRMVPLGSHIERTSLSYKNDVTSLLNDLDQLLDSLKPKEKQSLNLSGSNISTPNDKFFST